MDAAVLIGRILLASIFIFSGLNKFGDIAGTADQIAQHGLPMAALLAPLSAAVEVVAGILLVAGWQTRYAAFTLAAFTLAATWFFHNFWTLPDGAERTAQMGNFMKNIAIIGGFLVLAAHGAGRYAIEGRTHILGGTTRRPVSRH